VISQGYLPDELAFQVEHDSSLTYSLEG